MMKHLNSKVIFQIKFRPTLKHMGNMFNVASFLENSFEHWEVDGAHRCLLFDRNKQKSVSVSPDSITLVTTAIDLVHDPVKEMVELVTLMAEDGQIATVSGIGFRRLSVKSFKSDYSKYVNAYYDQFYGSRDALKSVLADSIEDVITILESIKDGYQLRTRFGPLKEQNELAQQFGVEKFDTPDKYPVLPPKEMGVLVDSHVFTSLEIKLSEAIAQFAPIVNLCNNTHKGVWELLANSGNSK